MRSTNPDPWESLNRKTFALNEKLDRYLAKPLAKAYRSTLPSLVRQAIGNFFTNLDEIDNSINNLLQWELEATSISLARLMINSTVGLGGLIEVSDSLGLKRKNADFGQTLATWRLASGPYLVLPILGPSTMRHTLSRPISTQTSYYPYVEDVAARNSLRGVELFHKRSELLDAEELISGDRYTFIRDVYLQQRRFFITGAAPADAFEDDDF